MKRQSAVYLLLYITIFPPGFQGGFCIVYRFFIKIAPAREHAANPPQAGGCVLTRSTDVWSSCHVQSKSPPAPDNQRGAVSRQSLYYYNMVSVSPAAGTPSAGLLQKSKKNGIISASEAVI